MQQNPVSAAKKDSGNWWMKKRIVLQVKTQVKKKKERVTRHSTTGHQYGEENQQKMAPNPLKKICTWNYRGLGGPSTISQLKEELRLHLLDFVFLCETNKKVSFVQTICKTLKYQNHSKVVDFLRD